MNFFVSVSSDVSQAISGLTSLGNELNKTTAQFQAAAPAALLLAGGGAAIATGFVGAIKTAADFEHQMSGVRAVMTPDEANTFGAALSDLAIVLGRDTVFTSREAAAGIEELIKAGIPAEAVLGGAASAALSLAAATGIGVPQAATIAAQTMNAFGKSASDLSHVVDILAGTANATAADMSDLQFGLQVVSATAGTMGLSFEDTTAAIGLFVSAGETGATAGTGLRQMLLELIPTTKPAKEEMLKLGLTTKEGGNAFFDAAGHVKSLAELSGILQNALKGMSDQQRIAALNTLFTRDAINSASILARTGAAAVNQLTDSIGQISAADSAKTRLNNLEGAMQNLGGSVETVQIIIGNLFLPTLTSIANTVRGVVDEFSKLSPEMQQAAVLLAGVAGAAGILVGGFVLLAPFISALPTAFAALGGILVAFAPLFLGLAGAAAVLFAAWQVNLFGLRDLVSAAFDRVPDVLAAVGRAFQGAGTLWAESILPGLQSIANAIEQRVIPVFNTIAAGPLGNLGLVFQKIFSGDIRGSIDTFIAIVGALVPGLGRIIVNIRTTVSSVFDTLGPILGNFGLVFQKVLGGDVGGAFDTLRAIIGAALPDVGKFLTAAGDLAAVVGPILGNAFETVSTFLRNEVAPRLGELAGNVLPTLQAASLALGLFWETRLGPALQAIGVFIATEVSPRLQAFADTAIPVVIKASQDLKSFWDTQLGPAAEAIGNFIAQNVGPAFETFGAALQAISTTGKGVLDFFAPFAAQLGAVAANIGPGIVDFFQTQLPAAFQVFSAQAASLGPFIESVGNFLGALFNVMTALGTLGVTALQGLFENVLAPGFQSLGTALAPIQPVISAVGADLQAMAGGLGLIGERIQPLTDFFTNATASLNTFADAVRNFQLPDWLRPGSGAGPFAPAGGPQLVPTGLNLGGGPGGGAGAISVTVNSGPITGEADENRLANKIAAAILSSTRRVTVPPDNTSNPQLSTGII